MKILIICSWFPPDTAISAVRPYMFAKYMIQAGHQVTVLRLGEFDKLPDKSNLYKTESLEVISALGPDCTVEKYIRGDHEDADQQPMVPGEKSGFKNALSGIVPERSAIRIVYNCIHDLNKAKSYFQIQQNALDGLKADGKEFDIVFSTYSNLENLYAGHYAQQLFEAKWIMDFRDPPLKPEPVFFIWNMSVRRALYRDLKTASMCTAVSDGFSGVIRKYNPVIKTVTINNGYEPSKERIEICSDSSESLSLCYTGGTLYDGQLPAVRELARSVSYLFQSERVDRDGLRIVYAGNDFDRFSRFFKEYGIDSIIDNRGYCDRDTITRLQEESDIFLNLSWNTRSYKGVVPGKFYEGIRARKYILSVIAGDTPDSELYQYNAKYDYGFCYECCRDAGHFNDMCDWIVRLYHQKTDSKQVLFSNNPQLEETFCYENLTGKLMEQMEKLRS